MTTVLQITFGPEHIVHVTYVKDGQFFMVKASEELMLQLLDIKKLIEIIDKIH